MIYWLTREDFADTAQKLSRGFGDDFRELRPLSYEQVFYEKKAPRGHYIFSDFDRMSSYEVECAIAFTDAIRVESPESKILNDPRSVLERVPLLKKLHSLGLNQFEVTRVDSGDRPTRYPVFLRSEDECKGPDTGMLSSPEELEHALEELKNSGHTLKRRIAVEFCAQVDDNGWFRKYGVANIDGKIIPLHIMRSKDWNVKIRGSEYDESFAEEEEKFVFENPHQDQLQQIFESAHIDFGRIDYTLIDGKIQTFEINTNPTYPQFKGRKDARSKRRALARTRVLDALTTMNSPRLSGQAIQFSLPKPCLQRPRIPRKSRFSTRLSWAFKEWESWDFTLLISEISRKLRR